MSFNSHKRQVLNELLPLSHRASHARSCVNHVANQLGTTRESIIETVFQQTGIDFNHIYDQIELLEAFRVLESLRLS